MIKHSEVKIGSEIERVGDGKRGEIFVFDSFNSVGVKWCDGETEYLVKMNTLDLVKY